MRHITPLWLVFASLLICLPGRAVAQADADAAFQARDWPKTESLYRAVLKKNPDDGKAWYRLGYALHAQRKFAEAIPAHEKAATFSAVAASATYNAACAYAMSGKADDSFTWLRKAVKAGFSDGNHLASDTDLVNLHGDPRFKKLLTELGATLRKYDAKTNDPIPSSKEFAALPQSEAFGFMGSEWKIENTFHSGRGSARTEGSNKGKPHLGGKVIIDHYTGKFWNGTPIHGITIRAFDEKTGLWSLVWLDDRQSPKFSPMIGKFVNGIGEFYPKGTTAKTAPYRFRWDNIGKGRARWMQQSRTLTDKGAKWMATWVMDFSKE